MGSYLSEPKTEKSSEDQENDKLAYGASSMQGWRESQEDAHNSILEFDDNTAYFAVYDGHGGHEVAQYCSQKLPNFIKNTEAYKKGNLEQALIEGFLGFDATIASPEVITVLKEIASEKLAEESDYEENVTNLYEEASMPIEKVIAKYANFVSPGLQSFRKGEKVARSPMIAAKGSSSLASQGNDEAGSSKDSAQVSKAQGNAKVPENGATNGIEESTLINEINGEVKEEKDPLDVADSKNGCIPEIKITGESDKREETPVQNGEVKSEETKQNDSEINEVSTNKAKGKAILKKVARTPIITRPKRNATQLYQKLLDFHDSEEDTEDEEDKNFVGPGEESSDEEEGVNTSVEAENWEEESSEEEEDEEGDVEEEEDEDGEEEEDDLEFARTMKEEPGSDSGCTAVVALLKGNELLVANAGDSRCIICRSGKAIEMSFDHKPEDEPERNRIVTAGGKVTMDGRVNGGLNLSRAIGDHAYKQNKDLSDKEQMITALPDIKKLTINPSEDEFMVLACDGIWNFMSSQEVVDFVKPRIDANPEKLSQICEEMFDHCLAPNTMGDGTGCDNMTAIIVKFKPNMKKRLASSESIEEDTESKRAKTEETFS